MPKVVHDTPGCIGCGACAAICPDFWELGDDGKAHLKGAKVTKEGDEITKEELKVKEAGCNKDAAESCPAKVILLK
jgi:ferredoxin